MTDGNQEYKSLQIITIGASNVGKTAYIKRIVENKFSDAMMTTIGLDSFKKEENINGKEYSIQIWDTVGQERFAKLATQYLRKAKGALLIYSINDRKTYSEVRNWLKMLEESNKDGIPFILIANKIDLSEERVVSEEEGQKLAEELGTKLFNVSCKTGENVRESFLYLINQAAKKVEENIIEDKTGKKLEPIDKKKKTKC